MLGEVLIRPTLHGALGPWDEIINLIPVVVGIVLVIYLYVNNRKRRLEEEPSPPPEEDRAPEV